jgi:hypothetical protein
MAGGVALHARANPKDDVDFLLYGVSLPLLVPVAGPIYFGGLVGYVTTLSLATSSGSASGLALALAPLGYGLTIVSVVDGVLQAKFLGQAFASESPAASRASLGIRLSPIAIPAIPSPLAPVGSARGLPAALGIGVPVTF